MENIVFEYITQKGMEIYQKWQKEKIPSKKITNKIYYDFFVNENVDDNTKLSYIYALNFRIKKRYSTFLKRFFMFFSYKRETNLFSKLEVVFKNDNDVINQLFMQTKSVNLAGITASGENSEDKKEKEKEIEKPQNKVEEKDVLQINTEIKNLEKDEEKEVEQKHEKIKEKQDNKIIEKNKNIPKEKIKENKKEKNIQKLENIENKEINIPTKNLQENSKENIKQNDSNFRVPIDVDVNKIKSVKNEKPFQNSKPMQLDITQTKQTSNEEKSQVVFLGDEFTKPQYTKNINTYTDYAMNQNANRVQRDVDGVQVDNQSTKHQKQTIIDENIERQKINDQMAKLNDKEVTDIKNAVDNTIKQQLDIEEQHYKAQKEKSNTNRTKEKSRLRANTVNPKSNIKM